MDSGSGSSSTSMDSGSGSSSTSTGSGSGSDDNASELDGITASQACCTCGGGSTADHGDSGSGSDLLLLEAKAKSKGPIMAKPIQGESMLVDVDAVVPEYE